MPENELMQAAVELGASLEAFAALAVHLGIETENLEAEPSRAP